jgi:hypothetical protein
VLVVVHGDWFLVVVLVVLAVSGHRHLPDSAEAAPPGRHRLQRRAEPVALAGQPPQGGGDTGGSHTCDQLPHRRTCPPTPAQVS